MIKGFFTSKLLRLQTVGKLGSTKNAQMAAITMMMMKTKTARTAAAAIKMTRG